MTLYLCWRLKHQLWKHLQWPIYSFNSVDNTKFSGNIPADAGPQFLFSPFLNRLHLFSRLATGEQGAKNVLTVTMVTHSFQAVAVSHVLVTTTLIRRTGAPVTEQLADVQPASTIPQASVVSAVNRVSTVTLLPGIVPVRTVYYDV